MRIKSKDIHFVQSIYYLANKKNFDINFLSLRFYLIVQELSKWLVYLLGLKLKEPASIPPASS